MNPTMTNRVAAYLRLLLLSGICWHLAMRAMAGEPTEQVKLTTERIVAIINDPDLKGDAHREERRRLLLKEIDDRFDWPAISRGCLGRHWQKLSVEQREEFAASFRKFLEHSYLDRLEPSYGELDRIDYQGEKIIDNYASVRVNIRTKRGTEHPVEYRLEKSRNGAWRIYDAVIEGVSLVKNYRVQFDEILARGTFTELLNDLKSRTVR